MAITDLTNTTWKFNDSLDFSGSNVGGQTFTISFSSANANNSAIVTYLRIGFGGWTSSMQMYIDYYPSTTTTFHNSAVLRGKWQNEGYKTITITGGTDATNATLISWLQSNATQVTLVNSTTLETTLHTAGKYCDKNILVKSSDSNLVAENIKKDVSVFGVTGNYAGTDVSDTTATQGDVLSGKYFYGSDGVKTEGTMTNHTETSITLNAGTGEQYVPAGHYSDILTKLVLNSDAASKIKQGEVILGVTGSYAGSGGSPIEVATETEMANILSSATADDNGKIYRYTGTTGTYVNGALYWLEVPSITLISFTIDGTSYQAEDGMTWGEWVDSSYNTGGFYVHNNRISTTGTNFISTKNIQSTEYAEYSTNVIAKKTVYYLPSLNITPPSGGGGGGGN